MKKQKSLVTQLWFSLTLIYTLVVCVLVYLWVGREVRDREAEFRQIRQTYIQGRQQEIKNQVLQAIHSIEHQKSLTEQRVRKEVRSRTLEAWQIAHHIWEKNRTRLTVPQIKQQIHDALFPAVWDDGKGYYFVEDTEGTELINRNNPELEGQNLMHVLDARGKPIMKEFLKVARSEAGEGFATYYWNKPDAPGLQEPKISYIKYFKPFDWVIGSGKYLMDEEETIKKEVLEYLETFTFGNDNYFFAGTFEGISLTGPFKGENKLDITDSRGVKIVQEMIRAAKAGGGFVYYMAPEYKGSAPAQKLSYARAVQGWNWYIGTGVHVDDIEAVIQAKQDEMRQNIRSLVLKSALVILASLLVSFFLAWQLSRRIRGNLDIFLTFFNRSANRHQPMPDSEISFTEFIPIARAANRMVKERNAYEAALTDSEKKYRQLFEKTMDATLTLENNGFSDCNQAAMDLLGITDREKIIGHQPADLSPEFQPDGQPSWKKAGRVRAEARSKGRLRFEWVHKKSDGTLVPVEVSVTVISDKKTGPLFHTVWRDITKRKQAEALMIQTEKMTTIGGLAAGMAHEINNPLAGIIQSAQMIRRRITNAIPANETAAEKHHIDLNCLAGYMAERGILKFLDTILETGNRAAKIVENMLNFSRKKPTIKSPHDLERLMDATIELARNDFSLKKDYDIGRVQIRKEIPPNLPKVHCDDNRIQQVFFNIIKNAVQAASHPEDEAEPFTLTLSICPSRENKEMVIRIRDNGPGMTEAVRKRIFEPFYTTKSVNMGTGLGLSVSYFIIVQDHGGRLEVSSEPGRGTCFTIGLPLRDPE